MTLACPLGFACSLWRIKASNQTGILGQFQYDCHGKHLSAWLRTSCWIGWGPIDNPAWHPLSLGMAVRNYHNLALWWACYHELPDRSDETVRTAKFVDDFSQPIMADSVKGLDEVHKAGVEADILFLTLLLQLPHNKYHMYCSMALTDSTLTLWKQVLLQVLIQMTQQDPSQVFPCNWKQGGASVVITILPVSFLFVEVNDQNIFELLWHFFLLQHGLVNLDELPNEYWATKCIYSCQEWGQSLKLCHWTSSLLLLSIPPC